MPDKDEDKDKDKGTKWDTTDVRWVKGFVMFILNPAWAQDVYDAIWTHSLFRLVVDGKVVASVPKSPPGSHSGAHTVLWGNSDVDWDDAGCLVIKDKKLGDQIVAAHDRDAFDIAVPDPAGPIGEGKINAMCPC